MPECTEKARLLWATPPSHGARSSLGDLHRLALAWEFDMGIRFDLPS